MSPIPKAKRVHTPVRVSGVGHDLVPFPLGVFPPTIAEFVGRAAAALPAPVDFVAVPVLATASAAIGTTRSIRLKPGYEQLCSLYLAIVGSPGAKKSPAMRMAIKPAMRAHLDEYRKYQDHLVAAELAGEKPPAHPPQRVLTDATTEAIAEALDRDPRGLLYKLDEMSGWLGSMDMYRGGKGADLQVWLSTYSNESTTVKRKRQAPLVIERPFVTVMGAIQPETLTELVTGRRDGFLDRLLFAYPDPPPFRRSKSDLPENLTISYASSIDALYSLEANDITGKPVALDPTAAATEAFNGWLDDHLEAMNGEDFPAHLEGLWSKLEGACLRLALILELLWRPDSVDVQHDSIDRAIELIAYFESHAAKVYAALGMAEHQHRLEQLTAWLRRQPSKRATVRDVQRSGTAGIKTANDARELLGELEDLGVGRLERDPAQPAKPPRCFVLL